MLDAASPRPTACIVIVTYNGLRYLDRCLATVFQQLGEQDEVIIVDNCSTDGGPQFIREFYPAARLVENRRNCGFAAACNQGARLATGRVLVFLNQDTEVQPGWLDGLVEALDSRSDVGLTTSRLLLMSSPDRINLCGQDVHYTGLVFGRGYGKAAASHSLPCDVDAVSGASFAISRELWERLGGFDECFFMYYEETDLSWRAHLAGYRCRYVPTSLAWHDYHRSALTETALYYSFRNRALLLLKSWSCGALLLLAPALLTAELLEVGLVLMQGRRGLRAKVRSNGWIALHLRQIHRMHAAAQAQPRVPDAVILRSLAADIRPTPDDFGVVSRTIVALANGLFRANRQAALWLLGSVAPDGQRPATKERP